jgi:hypothetical protein
MSTIVQRLAPAPGDVALEDVLDALAQAPALPPFDEQAIAACDAVARQLFRDPAARSHPELIVLASWLRRANVTKLAEEYARDVRVARGLAFHVPPANVDTIVMYTLALSWLAGNRNVMRLSSRAGRAAERICAALDAVLADPAFATLRAGTAVLTWDHRPEPTALCSAACDVRALWGGDVAVAALQSVPMRPGARDLHFTDRFSLAAAHAASWLAAGPADRDELARRLGNDISWFDQQGCSSPRLLVWCGSEEDAAAASDDLFTRMARQLEAAGYALPLGAVTAKQAWVAGATIDRPVTRVRSYGNALTVVELATLEGLNRQHPGAGVLLEAVVDELAELASHVARRDQTLAVFGFSRDELDGFVTATGGRGVDRITPFGDALRFEHHWDGMDLLAELTRSVRVAPVAPALATVAA